MKVTLGNTRCKVEGSVDEQAWLQKTLTIETGERDYMGRKKVYSFFRVGQGWFPAGLVQKVLLARPPRGVEVELGDERSKMGVPQEFKPLPGFDYFDFQEEALREILSVKQGLVHVATNGGKTVMMAGLLRTLEEAGVRGVIITHSKEIHGQLVETFRGGLEGEVGVLTSSRCEVRDRQFVVAMGLTLVNRIGDDPDVTQLWDEHQVLLADEAHHLQSDTWQKLFSTSNARIRLGFSGTIPDDGTYKGWLVRAYTGPVLIDVRNRELIDAGISARPTVVAHELDSKKLFPGLYKECLAEFAKEHGNLFKGGGRWRNPHLKMRFFGFYQRRCIEIGVIRNERRNKKIASVAADAWRAGRQCLIIVDRLEHGENLKQALLNEAAEVYYIHGDSPDRAAVLDLFKRGEAGVLISSQILDEGVDISGIDVLVLAGGMKCKRQLLQRIGRGLRKKQDRPNVLIIVDFIDFGNKYLVNYSKERQKVYLEEGFEVRIVPEGG